MDIDKLIQRIVLGFYLLEIDGELYEIRSPSFSIKSRAQLLYDRVIQNNKYDTLSWPNQQTIDYYATINNIWNKSYDEELKSLNKNLDQLKINLYLKYTDPNNRISIKKDISTTITKINELSQKKNYFSFLSLKDFADSIKYQYIICNIVYLNNELVFDVNNIDNNQSNMFNKITQLVNENIISLADIKTIARSQQWRTYWTASKEHIFPPPVINWTDEQILLINMSKMYDNIREHPECPTDNIIEDDDALDGWILHQNDKREKEKKKQQIEDRYKLKDKKGDEVFLLTQSKEEASEIYNLNDMTAKANMQEIFMAGKKDKNTNWIDLPHVQRELKQKVNDTIKQKSNKG